MSALLGVTVTTCLVMVVPGPSVMYAVTHGLRGGATSAAWAVLGLECGLGLHVLAACLGVGAVVAAAPVLLEALRLLGAAYLALLGVQMLRGPAAPATGDRVERVASRIFWGGFTLDVLNPKTLLFCLALLPQFVTAQRAPGAVLLLGLAVVAVAVVCDGGYAALAIALRGRRLRGGVRRWGARLPGVTFLALAGVALLG